MRLFSNACCFCAGLRSAAVTGPLRLFVIIPLRIDPLLRLPLLPLPLVSLTFADDRADPIEDPADIRATPPPR